MIALLSVSTSLEIYFVKYLCALLIPLILIVFDIILMLLMFISCVLSFRVFKKTSPNSKITVYVGKRDFIDRVTEVDPIGKFDTLIEIIEL
jgi:hypothetical protein